MERFFGFRSSTQPQESRSSDNFISLLKSSTMPVLPKEVILTDSHLLFQGYCLFSRLIKLSIVNMGAPAFPIPMALLLELHLPFMTGIQCQAYTLSS